MRKYNTTAWAIDQPVDFKVPESSLMHAVYLAIPQAENERRSLNIKNSIRRAKQLGRYPNKAPIGYTNKCAIDGKKYIAPHWPDADLIKWSFEQLAKNAYRIEDVRRMAVAKGLKCSRSNFWKLLHNPVYSGYIEISSNELEERQLIKGVHEPIITQALFDEVQNIIDTKRKILKKTCVANELFMLNKYLICPVCNRLLYASSSKGRNKRYPYYHCKTSCKIRFKADLINQNYERKLREIKISNGVIPLFDLILKDTNVNVQLNEYLNEQRSLLNQTKEQELFIAKVRKLFVAGKIEFDDFAKLKKEYLVISNDLNDELNKVTLNLSRANKQLNCFSSFEKILHRFRDLSITDKKHLIHFIPPENINVNGDIVLHLNHALRKILLAKKQRTEPLVITSLANQNLLAQNQYFKDRKVTTKKTIEVLARNNIHVNVDEAAIILDFLYLVAKFSRQSEQKTPNNTLSGFRIAKKREQTIVYRQNELISKLV